MYDCEMAGKKYQRQPDKPGRIKIKLAGDRNQTELMAMMQELGLRMAEMNVPCLGDITLYATMKDAEGKTLVPRKDRQPITELTIAGPYRSIAEDHGF